MGAPSTAGSVAPVGSVARTAIGPDARVARASATPGASAPLLAREATTWLFVPGDRPERFAKALAAGADAVIIDLEDAVAPSDKAAAREAIAAFLRAGAQGAFVRINDASSEHFEADLDLLRAALAAGDRLLGVVLPKAESSADIAAVRATLGAGLPIVALIESALGLHRVHEVAAAGIERIAFGAVDYAVDLGLGSDPRALDHARSVLTLASRVAGLPAPVDAPSLAIRDAEALAREAALAVTFGYGGKLCIHPAQVAVVAAAFAPTPAEIAWSQRVVDAAEAAAEAAAQGGAPGQGAVQLDGRMIDRPVIEQAERVLARAAAQTTAASAAPAAPAATQRTPLETPAPKDQP